MTLKTQWQILLSGPRVKGMLHEPSFCHQQCFAPLAASQQQDISHKESSANLQLAVQVATSPQQAKIHPSC